MEVMMVIQCFLVLFLLQLKHLVIDFLWQPEYEWRNKGTFGHPGGIIHSLKHAVITIAILIIFNHNVALVFLIAFAEFVAHYLIDYSKMNINKHYKYSPDKNSEFWYLLGVDQFLHQVCYLLIALAVL